MSTVSNSSDVVASSVSTRSRSRWPWLLGGLVVVALAWAGMRYLPDLGPGMLAAANDEAFYTVREADLVITLTEDGEVQPLKSIELKSEVEGRSTIRFIVEESKHVKKGELLVELASDQLDERISSEEIELEKIRTDLESAIAELDLQRNQNASEIKLAESDLEIARKDLKKYLDGDYEKQLKGIEIQIEETRLNYEQRKDDYDKNKDLKERGFVTEAKLNQIQLQMDTLKLKLDQHELSQRILEQYEKPMEMHRKTTAIEQADDALGRARKRAENRETQAAAKVAQYEGLLKMRTERLDRLKSQRSKCKIFAPTEGVVQYKTEGRWGNDEQLAVGSQVSEGQTLIVLPDTSQMIVSTRIHESDRHKVGEGMQCFIRVPAVPGESFTGQIAKVARFADSANRWLNPDLKEHTTEVLLADSSNELSPGDSAEVEILVDRVSGALAIPVQCVYSRGPRDFVFVRAGRDIEPVEVQLGPSNNTMVQVVHGLDDGDQIHLHPGTDLIALLPSADAERATPAGPGKSPGQRGSGKPRQSSASAKADPAAATEAKPGEATAAAEAKPVKAGT